MYPIAYAQTENGPSMPAMIEFMTGTNGEGHYSLRVTNGFLRNDNYETQDYYYPEGSGSPVASFLGTWTSYSQGVSEFNGEAVREFTITPDGVIHLGTQEIPFRYFMPMPGVSKQSRSYLLTCDRRTI